MKQRLLLVDDDEVFLRPLHRTLELAGYEVLPVQSGEEALDTLKTEDVDLILTDKRLPGMDGVALVRQIKANHADLAVVVMTAYGTIESAVEAMRLGAEDYLVKPFEAAEMLLVIRRAIEFQALKSANRRSIRRNQERFTFRNVVAKSVVMQSVFETLRSVADLDTTVLIHGETGVGKELLARSVHFSGARRDRPFVAVNCAAIPAELFESELFGSRKGAFTGASEHRRGHFQMAHGGTLLLDEIGEMPLHLQSKLLRAIEERKVTSVGADRPVDIDVRFIATTNKDLQGDVERGAFRRDLFYRLSVMPVRVPGEVLTELERFLAGPGGAHAPVELSLPFRDAKARIVEEFERAYVQGLLETHGGKLTAAAKHADMDPKNFSDKMARYGLRRQPAEPGDGGARAT